MSKHFNRTNDEKLVSFYIFHKMRSKFIDCNKNTNIHIYVSSYMYLWPEYTNNNFDFEQPLTSLQSPNSLIQQLKTAPRPSYILLNCADFLY